ncbi:MAG: tetratricopeptide repeat protein [Verrucomicrobiae bacterium]|nr:tetratricopeptide repeat protein [Verrucomicrobiae bacterium]
MTTDTEQWAPLPGAFARRVLPWLALAGGLALYLVTLNPWVTLESLPQWARVAGWVWQPPVTEPLTYVVYYPLRWLPPHWQPLALNLVAAVCAGLTLALLARSVALLPQDRTKDQRVREDGDFGLLTIRLNWIPPLLAVGVCALQEDFWKHAISGTGEMFNLLLFAYVIRCLLEYRVSERDSWLIRMAFVYGLATTNNWAMIGFFPLAVIAVVALKRMDLFYSGLFLKLLGAGVAGLLLYLLFPFLSLKYDHENVSFWLVLKANLLVQKQGLFFYGYRMPFLILAVSCALLPLVLVSIRWPASFGDVNPVSQMLVQFLFRVVHVGFFVVGLVMLWRPPFLETQIQAAGLSFLSLHYLGALCLGYFAGYLLLVFGVAPAKAWRAPGPLMKGVNYVVAGAVCLCVVAAPVALVLKNWPRIQALNSPWLARFAERLLQSIPEEQAVLLSDHPAHIWLVAAWQTRQQQPLKHVVLHSQSLTSRLYHEALVQRYPDFWPPLPKLKDGRPMPEPLPPLFILQRLSEAQSKRPLYYLHPSFGYYFELFHAYPSGLALALKRAGARDYQFPQITNADLNWNALFWTRVAPDLQQLAVQAKVPVNDVGFVARSFGQDLNQWGVALQRQGRLPEAAAAFQQVLTLNSNHLGAQINLAFNQQLRGVPVDSNMVARAGRLLGQFNNYEVVLSLFHPFDDPGYAAVLGRLFSQNGLNRQALQFFYRAWPYRTNDLELEYWIAQTHLQAGHYDEVLAMAEQARRRGGPGWDNLTNRMEWVRLQALAYYGQTNAAAAEQVLQGALTAAPNQPLPLAVATHVYLARGLVTNALVLLERHLRLEPDNPMVLLNQGVVLMQMQRYTEALAPLTKVLEKDPKQTSARLNRAIAQLQSNQLEGARRDYEVLRQSHPHYFAVYYGLGEIAWRQGQKKAAIEHYENYLKHAPKGIQERQMIEERLRQLKGK